ncbi:MAG TPA: SEC59/DGK1/VTE5 family protein [Candidatus Krumholzibacteria bacterium]|nr:SEC59/DGK1/VTE5 family protein [Candidatus Krumholzibacteria bacterium]
MSTPRHDAPEPKPMRHELQRKSFHLGMIVVPAAVYFLDPTPALLGLIIATFVTVAIDLMRLGDHRLRRFFLQLFRPLIRRHEEEHLLGSTHYMIAALLSVVVFDHEIAIAALMFLVLGDAAAAIIGKRFGKPLFWGKSPQGSIACFVVCLGLGWPLLRSPELAVIGALAATVAEAMPSPLDDNMRVPIFSGIAMQIAARFLQG